MIGFETEFGIVITALTLAIIFYRIKLEIEHKKVSTKGGILVGLAFTLSLTAIVAVALLTPVLKTRLGVLGFCITAVFLTYRFAKNLPIA